MCCSYLRSDQVLVTPDNVTCLLYLANLYLVEHLADTCARYLMEHLSKTTALQVLQLALLYGNTDLTQHAVTLVRKHRRKLLRPKRLEADMMSESLMDKVLEELHTQGIKTMKQNELSSKFRRIFRHRHPGIVIRM